MSLFGRLLATVTGQKSYSPPMPSTQTECVVLHCGGLVSVVGESHRQDAIRRSASEALPQPPFEIVDYALDMCGDDETIAWFQAMLFREPANQYDPNAIAVWTRHGHVGYLSRETAVEYQPLLRAIEAGGCDGGVCAAYTREADNGMLGVVLALSGAHVCLDQLEQDEEEESR